MRPQKAKRASYWTAVALPQPFILMAVGPIPGLCLAVWNSFHLRVTERWKHLALAVLIAGAVGLFQIHVLPGLGSLLAVQTDLPDHAAANVIRLALMVFVALVILRITSGQLDAYRERLFHGPLPTVRPLLAGLIGVLSVVVFIPASLVASDVSAIVASSLTWWFVR